LDFKTFSSVAEALNALEHEQPQVVVSDIRMPNGSGLDFLSEIKQKYPDIPVIIMTAYSDLESAVAAFQGGAFEYLAKPFDVDQAIDIIKRAVEESTRQASESTGSSSEETPEIIGQAPSMQEVFRAIGRLSRSHATVLINGESGSGKELVARALHRHSPRADKPFIAINTAAIPKDLLESELFGHERGAFTGAAASRRGRFEQADTGTLFLDEIGDMPADLQTRLLRVLSDGQFYRVGGHQPIKVNVRIIAATHQDLEQRVKNGLFREDLFHRLNVIRLRLPALRERREDIPLLIKHFLQHSAAELGVEAKQPSVAALKYLSAVNWSGNVRQLENVCHWLTVMAPGQNIDIADLPPELKDDTSKSTAALSWQEALASEVTDALNRGELNVMETRTHIFERILIEKALEHTHGRRIEAATQLGIGRNTLTRKIQELGLEE
jgi:two-component system nitrogen regulation response regulator GlnG